MNRTALLLVAFAGLLSATWAFAQGDAPAAAAPAAKGKVTGRVVYDGKPPEIGPLKVEGEKSRRSPPRTRRS
jgi:hypothetical protein